MTDRETRQLTDDRAQNFCAHLCRDCDRYFFKIRFALFHFNSFFIIPFDCKLKLSLHIQLRSVSIVLITK